MFFSLVIKIILISRQGTLHNTLTLSDETIFISKREGKEWCNLQQFRDAFVNEALKL